MSERKSRLQPVNNNAVMPPILLQNQNAANSGKTRWPMLFNLFTRLLPILVLLEAVMFWNDILGPDPSLLHRVPLVSGAAIAFFAVIDLIIVVGLWLSTPWGGLLWMMSIVLQIAAVLFLPGFGPLRGVVFALDGTLIITYLFLKYKVKQGEYYV